jgi:hypothetical protein
MSTNTSGVKNYFNMCPLRRTLERKAMKTTNCQRNARVEKTEKG